MRTGLKLLLFAILNLVVYQCTPANMEPQKNNLVVVESYLMPNKPVRVKLKKAVLYGSDKNSEEILDALLITFSTQQKTYTMKSVGGGVYTLAEACKISAGESYKINFAYANKQITAETTIPYPPKNFSQSADSLQLKPVTITDKIGDQLKDNSSIRLTWSNHDNAYYYVVIYNVEKRPIPIVTAPTGQNINPFAFSSKPTQTNAIEVNTAQFQYFGVHQIILFRVNSDYGKLYNSGYAGRPSQAMSVTTSSVYNSLGLFTGMSSDTLFFKVIRK